eukprot:7225659-Alexandrium_andersonii.AAC.1
MAGSSVAASRKREGATFRVIAECPPAQTGARWEASAGRTGGPGAPVGGPATGPEAPVGGPSAPPGRA